MSRFGLVHKIDNILEKLEKRVRSWESDYAKKLIHQSPCIFCKETATGSRIEGFTHTNGNPYCTGLPRTRKATPSSLFKNKEEL